MGKFVLYLGSSHPRRVQAHQGKGEEMTKIHMAWGANDTRHWCQTTHIWQPPLLVHCATHKHQPACNPMPKIQTRDTRNATQRLPKWWWSTDRVDITTVTHLNQVISNIW
jgi:hypothetical protein